MIRYKIMDKNLASLAYIENIVTILVTGFVILGLAVTFKSLHCLWGLLIMCNINTSIKVYKDNSGE